MKSAIQFLKAAATSFWLTCGLLVGLAALANAQAPDSATGARVSIVSVSPVELFYKAAIGYEHSWGRRNSLGVIGTYCYGFAGRYQGWQVTGYYRRFLTRQFPTGLYVEAQASVFDFLQEANLVDRQTHKVFSFDYRQPSGGAGIGMGYRYFLLRRTFSNHLLADVMLGLRIQVRPAPAYDAAIYYPDSGFLGETDEANWHLSFGPGTFVHGLLTLGYLF